MRTQDRPQTGWEDLDDVCEWGVRHADSVSSRVVLHFSEEGSDMLFEVALEKTSAGGCSQ